MRSLLLLLLAAASVCLAHGAEPTPPRQSLAFDLIPTRPRSDSDKQKCINSILALAMCKHDLILASFFAESRIPRACCRAADEIDDHCGSFTRTFFRSLLPRDLFQRCARQVTIRSPRVPPRAPPLAPPVPEAQTSSRPAPPRTPKVSGRVPHPIAGPTSAYLPPPYPAAVPHGKYTPPPPPKVGRGTYAPVVSGGPGAAGAPPPSAVPGSEDTPKPKVITGGGSAGGGMRRAPGSYGPATQGAPLAAAASAPPNYGARMGTQILP